MMSNIQPEDERINRLIEVIRRIRAEAYDLNLPAPHANALDELAGALRELASELDNRRRETLLLQRLTHNINAGLMLEEVLERIYLDFREIIPYHRIGVALIDEDGHTLRSCWVKSDQERIRLGVNFSAPLAGSSLEDILHTGNARILNDLPAYLQGKPDSASTRLIVQEGMCSSLTCPLLVDGKPVGFIFFSSRERNTYRGSHIDIYRQVASQISIMVDKGRMVSALAAQKQQIEVKNRELIKLNMLKNTFLGIAAHDLRSPAGYIQMTINLLRGPDAELYREHQDELLEQVARQAQRMLSLLNDLLDLTEIEAGGMRIKRSAQNVETYFVDILRTQSLLATPKNIELRLEFLSRGTMLIDPDRLRQVMDNLIINAIKYSSPGSKVWVTVGQVGPDWRVGVRDEGPGISDEDRPHLFEAFGRVSSMPTGGEKATGLGLAISRWIVEAHGGQIGVDSQPGQGATFWFTLPGYAG